MKYILSLEKLIYEKLERYASPQDEKLSLLLERIRDGEMTKKDKKLLYGLRDMKELIEPYVSGKFMDLLAESVRYRFSYISSGIIDITTTAQDRGVSTSVISRELRELGYEIKYDRNRKYCKERVITYAEVR